MSPLELLELAIVAAKAGAAELVARAGNARTFVGSKTSSTDMVTDADRASEAAVIEILTSARPDDAILGEESGERSGTSGFRWVIDPLDGTTNFLYGIPQWCVSVAVEDGDGGVAGCVLAPILGETFAAARGEGATLNGETINVSAQPALGDALLATGFSYLPEERETAARMLPAILPRVRDIRRPGSAALDLAWVACGRLDGYFEAPVFPWDGAAGSILVREAGGRVEPMAAIGPSGSGLVASGPGVFENLKALVLQARDVAGLRT